MPVSSPLSPPQTSRMPAYGLILLVLAAVAAFGNQAMAAKPNDPAVLSAIDRGSQYLARMGLVAEGGRAGMAVLGLLKTGTSPDDAVVQKIIDTKLLPKFQDGVYRCSVGTDLYYEAGVDLMVYILAHPEAHEKEIAVIRALLSVPCWASGTRNVPESQFRTEFLKKRRAGWPPTRTRMDPS